jgi:hypothetical protein
MVRNANTIDLFESLEPEPQIRSLGIIGTAGRKDDKAKMSRALYEKMCEIATSIIRVESYTHMVSGGAAWADHVAVTLALRGVIACSQLTLHLPAYINDDGFEKTSPDGNTANYYHGIFMENSGINGIKEINLVRDMGAEIKVNTKGFKSRNTDVARQSNGLLAFTFGSGNPLRLERFGNVSAEEAGLKDGGTADTFNT